MWIKIFRNFLINLKKRKRYFYFIYHFETVDKRFGNADLALCGYSFPSKELVMYYAKKTWLEKGVVLSSMTFNQIYEFKNRKDYINWLGIKEDSVEKIINLNTDLDDNSSDKRIN